MQVTQLEYVDKNKCKVYLDEQFAFVLYKGELSRHQIELEKELPPHIRQQIEQEVLVKRAQKRVLYLLQRMARTEAEIRKKLKEGFYSDHVIDQAVAYAKKFGYINDENYIRFYIEERKQSKSKKEILYKLMAKGVAKDLIIEAMETLYEEENEAHTIRTLLRKKKYDPTSATEKEKQKVYGYLMRKGFSYHEIKKTIMQEV